MKRRLRQIARFSAGEIVAIAWQLLDLITVGRLAAVIAGIAMGLLWFSVFTTAKPILRDLIVTVAADKMAGPAIPLVACNGDFAMGREDCDLIYTNSDPLCPNCHWGIVTNSNYLNTLARMTIPYYEQEGLVQNLYFMGYQIWPWVPRSIAFIPMFNADSFHLLGQTNGNDVILNERVLYFEAWNDARSIRETLTHEMIHDQGGYFFNYPEPLPETCIFMGGGIYCKTPISMEKIAEVYEWLENSSVWVEQHTQSATIEVLAAECRMSEENACGAFWLAIGDAARGSLYTELHQIGLGFLYDPLMSVLIRNQSERVRAEKMNRYWQGLDGGAAQRDAIIAKYQAGPWLNYVLPGVLYGQLEQAGTPKLLIFAAGARGMTTNSFPFDDTALMFGPVGRTFLWLMTPKGGTGDQWTTIQQGIPTNGLFTDFAVSAGVYRFSPTIEDWLVDGAPTPARLPSSIERVLAR